MTKRLENLQSKIDPITVLLKTNKILKTQMLR